MSHDHHHMMDHSEHDLATAMARCSMNMLWNTQIIDTCIVFRSWHVTSKAYFFGSCLAIVALGILYEYLRAFQKSLDTRIAIALVASGKGKTRARSGSRSGRSSPDEDAGLLSGRRMFKVAATGTPVPLLLRLVRAGLYGATVFLSFFLMLVFMTYNAYLILATVLGAALGHLIFNSNINIDALLSEESKGMACH
ncbi:FAD-binding FR-type domain-containing protein [Mycena indigotica]|uniref:Copper transport protein n=1 Tax=Mycena indigotica TaxID=2126181 RepID=A0A8H6WGB3_9AGAR|nr:FAD-binding FR-type domain-containing protein [Mycena indigotica]KAF7315661.1 FAD-binding FR-type domain-containing protein [Mycena indigotica]